MSPKQELEVLTMANLLRGPQQGSGKETSKSLRGSIDIGGDLSLSPPPLGGLRGQCINISLCHVFFALCSDVEGRWYT